MAAAGGAWANSYAKVRVAVHAVSGVHASTKNSPNIAVRVREEKYLQWLVECLGAWLDSTTQGSRSCAGPEPEYEEGQASLHCYSTHGREIT